MGRIKYSKVKVELQAIWVLWRNWLARPAVNREVVSSSLTRTGFSFFFGLFLLIAVCIDGSVFILPVEQFLF